MRLRLLFLLLCVTTFLSAQEQNWFFHKEVEGIKVYSRENEDSYIKELKMTTKMEAPVETVYKLLNELPLYKKWIYGCSYAELLERPNDLEMHYYAVTDFPWPMQDRDYVVSSKTTRDPSTGTINSVSIASSDARKPVKKNMVRITDMKITWRMSPLPNNHTQIDYYLKSDPGGNIPAWAVNLALDRGPRISMREFKKLLKNRTP